MDSTLKNTGVDRINELFEYEMTDVILKLKGEISAVSGEVVSKIADNIPIPQMLEEKAPKSIVSEKIGIEYPAIGSVNIVDIGSVVGETVRAFSDSESSDSLSAHTELTVPETNINIQFKPIVLDYKPSNHNSGNLSEHHTIQASNIKEINIQKTKVQTVKLPDPITPFSFPSIKTQKISSSIQAIDISEACSLPNISTAHIHKNTPDVDIQLKASALCINVQKPSLSIPEIDNISSADISGINRQPISLPAQRVSHLKEKNITSSIKRNEIKLNLPQSKSIASIDAKIFKVNKKQSIMPNIDISVPNAKKYFSETAISE